MACVLTRRVGGVIQHHHVGCVAPDIVRESGVHIRIPFEQNVSRVVTDPEATVPATYPQSSIKPRMKY